MKKLEKLIQIVKCYDWCCL